MITLWRTKKAASDRQDRLLAAKRADQLRVEVAAILAERPTTLDSQRETKAVRRLEYEQMAR
jgi:hypothetical protein